MQTAPQGPTLAALEDERAALTACVDQFTTRMQALESGKMRLEDENTRLAVSLQQAQGDLHAAEGRELRQMQENLDLGDLLRVYVDFVR